jgi:two-component system sensor histidine kinase CpxA
MRLSWKVFFGFWIATILVILISTGLNRWFADDDAPTNISDRADAITDEVAMIAKQRGVRGVETWQRTFASPLRLTISLKKDGGELLVGRRAEDWQGPAIKSNFQTLMRDVLVPDIGTAILTTTFYGRDRPSTVPNRSALRHFALMIIVSGVVCWLLAQFLASPIRHVSHATRQLANGDLGARVDDEVNKRQDEVGMLARDFNMMATRLERQVETQRRLLRDVSHEVRSPLARINVALELGRKHANDAFQALLDRIALDTTRLDTLIGHLLQLARTENQDEQQSYQYIDLTALVREVVTDVDFEAQADKIQIHATELTQTWIHGEPAALRSAVENLLRNAIHYSSVCETVDIKLTHVNTNGIDRARLSVRDRGPGVPEAALDKIFQPFYRVSDARERDSGGTGLGLAIVAQAASLHGGAVNARNYPSGGLEITLDLALPDAEHSPDN